MDTCRTLKRIDAALAGVGAGGLDPFAAAVRATRMPILVTNPRLTDFPVVFVNDAFCRLMGYARAEILGRNCRFLQGPDTDQATVSRLREAVRAEAQIELDPRISRRRSSRPITRSATPPAPRTEAWGWAFRSSNGWGLLDHQTRLRSNLGQGSVFTIEVMLATAPLPVTEAVH